jgi:hypothetical protein
MNKVSNTFIIQKIQEELTIERAKRILFLSQNEVSISKTKAILKQTA